MELKIRKYLQKNHPEKARDFGCAKGGWFNGFKLIRALYKENGIDDPEFIRWKREARQLWTALLWAFGAVVCIIVLGLLVFVVVLPRMINGLKG